MNWTSLPLRTEEEPTRSGIYYNDATNNYECWGGVEFRLLGECSTLLSLEAREQWLWDLGFRQPSCCTVAIRAFVGRVMARSSAGIKRDGVACLRVGARPCATHVAEAIEAELKELEEN